MTVVVLCFKYTILIGVCQGVSLKNFRFYPEKFFLIHSLNVCGNVPLIGDDADGLAVVVCESHLNHCFTFVCYVLSIYYISAFVKSNL